MLRVIGAVSLLWLVMVNPFVVVVAQGPIPHVLDTTGQSVEAGVEYYILPASSTSEGGGLTLVDRNGSCPFYVGQEDQANSTGLPVIFFPFVSDETVIRESSDFTLYFTRVTICEQSPYWGLDNESNPTLSGRTLIKTTETDLVYLQIRREGDDYKLYFCPTDVCSSCNYKCGDVGISIEDGKRLLALYVPALPVVFKRA